MASGRNYTAINLNIVNEISKYSTLPNNRSVPNKSVVACKFFDLLHKNARFWPFLASF